MRGQILLAFLTMSVITAALGYFSVRGLEREGTLVDRTFDRSLMSINFSRAAAADFKDMQAVATRRAFSDDAAARARYDKRLVELDAEMDDDLSVAVERAQSEAAVAVGRKVQHAVADWKVAMQRILADTGNAAAWASLDRAASTVAQELDLLVNYTAGDGFTYRQSAHATIRADRHFNIAATLLAVLASGAIAWLLSRRLVHPIEKASEIAGKIADGDLEVRVPQGNADELGALLAAMETMRGNVKSSMEREVELRRSAQTRLAAALESSCEGIVVVGADDRIALANAQASRLLGPASPPLVAGDTASEVERVLASVGGGETRDYSRAHDVELSDGRWLRMSRSRTQEGGSIFVYSDVSLVKAQQAALKTANMWLDAALANLSQGLCLFDAANRLKVYNQRFCELFGLSPSRMRQGMTLDELIEIAFQADLLAQPVGEFRTDLMGRIADRRPSERLYQLRQGRTVAVSHRPLEERSWLATYEDVTDRLQAAEKISYMARHDALTGLPNRAFFVERIETALAALDTGGRFALLCLDLDRFKEVNDTLGHPIGDKLLTAAAGRLRGAVRGGDMVVRLGGDEFAIIQTIESDADAAALADRIIAAIGTPFEIEGHPLTIGVSIGISLAPLDGRSYDELLKNADLALYRAKDEGRNGWHFFERAMDERQRARRLVELDLRQALEHDQFELEYHPLVEVESDRISGFEALLRWRHPTRGSVAPAVFIPIAEEIGLIAAIGDLVLHRACRDAVRWPGVSVAVNVSGTQLRNGRLLDVVLAALESSGLPAHRLILEITESVLIANAQSARVILDQCKALGIRIAMDDFGTGYSSLSYLRSFPFDDVKIDKSFISEVTTQPESAAIVHAIVALCASLGMRTTAEGVETPEQLAFLRQEGCHAAQGFLFSRPVAAETVPRLLEARSASAPGRSAMKAA